MNLSTDEMLERARKGDCHSLCSELLDAHRQKLVRMVQLRLDRQLAARVDASDIVQEANLEATRRFQDFLANGDMDFFVWLRWITHDKIVEAYRHHCTAQKRSVGQEVSMYQRPRADATSFALAEHLIGQETSPSGAASKTESRLALEQALNELDPIDREVLVLRHFEHLSNNEVATILGIKKSGASRRYVNALKKLKEILNELPAFSEFF